MLFRLKIECIPAKPLDLIKHNAVRYRDQASANARDFARSPESYHRDYWIANDAAAGALQDLLDVLAARLNADLTAVRETPPPAQQVRAA